MKLNRKHLRKMILTEIKKLQETREDHIQGIRNKITALESELSREQAFHGKQKSSHPMYSGEYVDDYSYYDDILSDMGSSEDRSDVIKKKINLLKRQLASFEQADGGDIGYGNMPRY
jgi:chromosome segregation ATPase